MDKRSVQLTLPLGLTYEPDHKEFVKQHWNVTFARQKKMSVLAKRIMAKVIDQIRDDDLKLKPFYQFRMIDLVEDSRISKQALYRDVEGALYELAQVVWEFKNPESEQYEIRHLIDTTKEQSFGYDNGIVTVLLNPQLEPYFLQIAHYTRYQLQYYMTLKSWYSVRFYEMLSAYKDTGEWTVSVEDYRHLMDCGPEKDKRGQFKISKDGTPKMKYPTVRDLVKNTMTEPLEELQGTDMAFSYEPIYEESRQGRGRRRIVAFTFKLKHMPRTSIPESWLAHQTIGQLVEKLRKWKVTDRNMALYLEDMGTKRAKELIREWELKENSNRRIDDKAKYCNSVFVTVGKEVQQQLRQEVSDRLQGTGK